MTIPARANRYASPEAANSARRTYRKLWTRAKRRREMFEKFNRVAPRLENGTSATV